MSYTPTTWETGDTITAEKLNKIEGACVKANCVMLEATTEDYETWTLPKTFAEIKALIDNGCIVAVLLDYTSSLAAVYDIEYMIDYICSVTVGSGEYSLITLMNATYVASSENGYPAHSGGST